MFELMPWRRKEEPSLIRSTWPFHREFDEFVEKFFSEMGLSSETRGFSPAVDIQETDEEIIVSAELPGMEREDFDISLRGDMLTIKGEKKQEYEQKEENFTRIERRFGMFSRTFSLPCEIQEDKVEAKYKNGILTLKLPKAEECRKKPIKITVH